MRGSNFGLNPATSAYEAVLNLNAPLTRGDYVLRAQPAIRDTDGNALDGDYNWVAGGVFGFSFSVDPLTVGPEFRVNTSSGNDQGGKSVASDARGNFVVVWATTDPTAPGSASSPSATASGVPLGGEFRVNTYTDNDQGGGLATVIDQDAGCQGSP